MRWRVLAAGRDWRLAHDEEHFLDQALIECLLLVRQEHVGKREALALARIYGAILYDALNARRERAAVEMRQSCFRLSRYHAISEQDAEDIAQEMLARVIEKLEQLREKRSFLAWAMRIQRDVTRSLFRQSHKLLTESLDSERLSMIADERDLAQEIEDALLSRELAQRMRAILSDIESFILVCWVVQGDKPREIAADLNLRPDAVRVHKSRALQKLGRDDGFVAFLAQLAGR